MPVLVEKIQNITAELKDKIILLSSLAKLLEETLATVIEALKSFMN